MKTKLLRTGAICYSTQSYSNIVFIKGQPFIFTDNQDISMINNIVISSAQLMALAMWEPQ